MKIRKNTALARKLVSILKRDTGYDFPGGPENACIERTRYSPAQVEAGAVVFHLRTIDGSWQYLSIDGDSPAKYCTKAKQGNYNNYELF